MDSAVIRDYLIVIAGGLILLTIVLTGILGFLLYRQIKALNASISNTIQLTRELGTEVKEAAGSAKELINVFKPGGTVSDTKGKDKAGVRSTK